MADPLLTNIFRIIEHVQTMRDASQTKLLKAIKEPLLLQDQHAISDYKAEIQMRDRQLAVLWDLRDEF